MKCICPMGGERECPPSCTPEHRREHLVDVIEKLRAEGKSQKEIAKLVDLSVMAVSNALRTFNAPLNVSKRRDTLGRVGNTGRPRKKKAKQTDPVRDQIISLHGAGLSSPAIAKEVKVDGRAIRHELHDEEVKQKVYDELLDAAAAKHFEGKGKLRIEDAIRIHKKNLDRQFEQRVNEEVRRRIAAADDAVRENYKKVSKENLNLHRLLDGQAVFTKTQFRQLQMLCHPDSSASAATRSELLQFIMAHERRLVKQEVPA